MPNIAEGTFEVHLTPQSDEMFGSESKLGRMFIDKSFQGELSGTSEGQMLSARTSTDGSAGYVAIERVNATLGIRSGTFVLQHVGTMNRGKSSLTVTVVPDSGTDDLEGISGTMNIIIKQDRHYYEFEYSFADD